MTPPLSRPLPRPLRESLRPETPSCYRHCSSAARGRRFSTPLPGEAVVYACPQGAVSVTRYSEWTNRNPAPAFARYLRARTVPPELVRRRDLRGATRHGPELGRPAERLLANAPFRAPVKTVYWRLYPYRAKDGTAYHLFVCWRHGRDEPRFFAAPTQSERPACPVCARGDGRPPRSDARPRSVRAGRSRAVTSRGRSARAGT